MRSLPPVTAGLAAVATLAACGGSHSLPAACRADSGAIVAALRSAPGPVAIDGVRLSRCVERTFAPGDVQFLGGTLVEAASKLSGRARARPEGESALELGYLVGAARRGAGHNTGVVEELMRRLDQESAGLARSRAFARGRDAGRAHG